MMGYELYRQLSNKKSRKKKGKNYPTLEESKEKNESSLYGKLQITVLQSWIYKNQYILWDIKSLLIIKRKSKYNV